MTGEGRRYELVLADRSRVPIEDAMIIGRAPGSTLLLDDGTVSRRHARIAVNGDSLTLEDAGSSHGTWVDGRRVHAPVSLHEGARIRLGEQELVVERRRRDSEAGLTVVVPADVTEVAGATDRPRLRSGYALKRLAASEGPRRWVLRDLRSERFLRLGDEDGALLELVDGRRSVLELVGEAERRVGAGGGPRMVRLLAELADRGFLDGAEGTAPPERARGWRGLLAAREWAWPEAGDWLEALYVRGGWRLFTRPALMALAAVAAAGLVAFAYLIAGRYGTPFVVASKVGIGGIVFVLGRLAVAAVHETAHGLAMAAFGRHVGRAGLKLVLIFPYAFVDTSEAWFEPRRRRIAVSAAGPVSDAVLGGAFSLACLMLGAGALRDICFQLAFGAWVGAVVNLNPFVERDGYHILADALGEPGLRRRARVELARRLRGEATGAPATVLVRYAVGGLVWSVVAAGLGIAVSLRYAPALLAIVPAPIVVVLLMSAWLALLTPVLAVVGGPVREWIRRPRGAR